MSALDVRAMGERAQRMVDALAAISAEPDRLTRLFLSPEHKRATHQVGEWMRRAGMQVRMDSAGTMHGFLPAGIEGPRAAKKLLLGSHIDTIIDAGRYDGILGVVAAIVAVEEMNARGIKLPFGLEILAFGDEEGVRFPKTLLGSSTVAGIYEREMLELTDAAGVPIGKALLEFGGDPQGLPAEGMRRGDVIGYLEVHIEQGPVLERAGEALGVVSAIASQGRYRLRVTGEAGHAGTVPMELRHDALATAAEIVLLVEELARKGSRHALVGTVGEIVVTPGASNVIPGSAQFSLDIRASTDEARIEMAAEVRSRIRQIGARRGVIVGMEMVHEKPVAVCAPGLKRAIAEGIRGATGLKAREVMSGAGHDGQAMIHLTDIGMIFVRCRAGISHNPLEFVTVEDIGLAVEALVRTIVEIAQSDGA